MTDQDVPAPRFYFNVVGASNIRDPFGQFCRDDASAIKWAQSIAASLSTDQKSAAVVIVRDNGEEVARIPICQKGGDLS